MSAPGRQTKERISPLDQRWTLWRRVDIDIMYMPETPDGYRCVIAAKECPNGWVKAEALKSPVSECRPIALPFGLHMVQDSTNAYLWRRSGKQRRS